MEFYAPMFVTTGIAMLAAMALTLLPEASWWAKRQHARIRNMRHREE
jgi:hypothetical protein